jgi:uncharacterized protein YdeI (YjbR/CyaY-like superfamily)
MSEVRDDEPIIQPVTPDEWHGWLAEHHETAAAVWVKLAKKSSGIPSPSYEESVEVALCFGWIDGLSRGFDEYHRLQRFTPRRKRSSWSQRNRERAEALIASGRMQPAGLREVERAKEDGRWDTAG